MLKMNSLKCSRSSLEQWEGDAEIFRASSIADTFSFASIQRSAVTQYGCLEETPPKSDSGTHRAKQGALLMESSLRCNFHHGTPHARSN